MSIYGSYKAVRSAAWKVLINFHVTELPVDVSAIAARAGISVIKNTDTQLLLPDEAGTAIQMEGKWFIIYNDTMPTARVRFTIVHELGHIFLGHPLIGDRHLRKVSKDRPQSERDSDMFAARLLCPAVVLWALNLHTPEEIQRLCNVSYAAAVNRAERMKLLYSRDKFLSGPLEECVFQNFKDFIHKEKSHMEK